MMQGLSDPDLATLRKVVAHFLLCKDVQAKYAAPFQAQAKEIAARMDAETERRSHMARHQRPSQP